MQSESIGIFLGPLPPPEVIAAYKRVDPKLVDVIAQLALSSSTFAESRDQKIAHGASKLVRSLTLLGIGALFLAGYLAHLGLDVAAVITAIVPFGAWVTNSILAIVRQWMQRPRGRDRH